MKEEQNDYIISLTEYERMVGFFSDTELNKDTETFSLVKRRAILGNRTEAGHKLIILNNEKTRRSNIQTGLKNAKK